MYLVSLTESQISPFLETETVRHTDACFVLHPSLAREAGGLSVNGGQRPALIV